MPWWKFCRILFGVSFINLVIVTIWLATDPPKTGYEIVDSINLLAVHTCSCKNQNTWMLLEVIFFVSLLVFGGYLAFVTREIWERYNYPNESKSILLSIFNITFTMIILGPLILAFHVSLVINNVLFILTIAGPTTFSLFMVHGPKLVEFLGSSFGHGTQEKEHTSNRKQALSVGSKSFVVDTKIEKDKKPKLQQLEEKEEKEEKMLFHRDPELSFQRQQEIHIGDKKLEEKELPIRQNKNNRQGGRTGLFSNWTENIGEILTRGLHRPVTPDPDHSPSEDELSEPESRTSSRGSRNSRSGARSPSQPLTPYGTSPAKQFSTIPDESRYHSPSADNKRLDESGQPLKLHLEGWKLLQRPSSQQDDRVLVSVFDSPEAAAASQLMGNSNERPPPAHQM